jgi:uncharacterized protein YkwD
MLLALAAGAAAPSAASAACAGEDVPVADVAVSERTMLCLLNEYRVAHGRTPLVLDVRLARAARAHADDMVARGYFDHYTPEDLGPSERARAQGFPGGAGENIAWSTNATPRSTFEQWRTSSGHNRNMLEGSYNVTGLGFAVGTPPAGPGTRGATGVQTFGRVAVPAGGDTGLGDVPPAAAPAPVATPAPPAAARTPAPCRVAHRVGAARARLAAARRRAARARGRRARVRAVRRVRVARRALARARVVASTSCS